MELQSLVGEPALGRRFRVTEFGLGSTLLSIQTGPTFAFPFAARRKNHSTVAESELDGESDISAIDLPLAGHVGISAREFDGERRADRKIRRIRPEAQAEPERFRR